MSIVWPRVVNWTEAAIFFVISFTGFCLLGFFSVLVWSYQQGLLRRKVEATAIVPEVERPNLRFNRPRPPALQTVVEEVDEIQEEIIPDRLQAVDDEENLDELEAALRAQLAEIARKREKKAWEVPEAFVATPHEDQLRRPLETPKVMSRPDEAAWQPAEAPLLSTGHAWNEPTPPEQAWRLPRSRRAEGRASFTSSSTSEDQSPPEVVFNPGRQKPVFSARALDLTDIGR
mmetsp:Transcript_54000/g.96708  ORF Transcript_54000/g.96708 Transcript_54000/m.96708 type:complete len:231 (+) Transcript_54000:60-752(+)